MKKIFKKYTIGLVNTSTLNVTLLAENDCVVDFTSYYNVGGNCLAVSLCDIYNNDCNFNMIIPSPRKSHNNSMYRQLCDVIYDYAIYKKVSLVDLINANFTGIVCICCKGHRHAISMINGLILNNWRNRYPMSLKEFKNELHYSKTPKVCFYIDNATIHRNNKIMDTLDAFNKK